MVDAQDDWNSSSISCGTAKYRVMFVVRWPMARGELSRTAHFAIFYVWRPEIWH
jgi:hypothetical protein